MIIEPGKQLLRKLQLEEWSTLPTSVYCDIYISERERKETDLQPREQISERLLHSTAEQKQELVQLRTDERPNQSFNLPARAQLAITHSSQDNTTSFHEPFPLDDEVNPDIISQEIPPTPNSRTNQPNDSHHAEAQQKYRSPSKLTKGS